VCVCVCVCVCVFARACHVYLTVDVCFVNEMSVCVFVCACVLGVKMPRSENLIRYLIVS